MDWTFGGTWPYEAKWFESEDGRMHYVDEGPRAGKPVVMVHGNPCPWPKFVHTWAATPDNHSWVGPTVTRLGARSDDGARRPVES